MMRNTLHKKFRTDYAEMGRGELLEEMQKRHEYALAEHRIRLKVQSLLDACKERGKARTINRNQTTQDYRRKVFRFIAHHGLTTDFNRWMNSGILDGEPPTISGEEE